MANISNKLAKIVKANRISVIWLIPIITAVIGLWVIYSHYANQGKSFTLIAEDASGIVAGKTSIKSRSVDVGIVETVTLSDDFKQVVIQARLNPDMEELLKNDTLFWIVKPQIGREGVTGLGTLLSGVYIELASGNDNANFKNKPFVLSDSPPLSAPTDSGVRIYLTSDKDGVIPRGAPVMFRGFRVGNVETSNFDAKDKLMRYQVFISKPYDELVTNNVRFWKEGGINLSLSARGASLDMPPLDVMFSGGISFGLPEGQDFGTLANPFTEYVLYEDRQAINHQDYNVYREFLLFFSDSVSGLTQGSAVEYRGIRIGTVAQTPFISEAMLKDVSDTLIYDIPVMVRIEPERLSNLFSDSFDIFDLLISEQKRGLRATLRSGNILTGSLYIDLDFHSELINDDNLITERYGYPTIATVPSGLAQIQSKIIQSLDNFNKLPLDKTIDELNSALRDSQKLMMSLNQLVNSNDIQSLPKDIHNTMNSLNETLRGLQPGSDLHRQLKSNLDKIEKMMDQLTPLLNTLNDKSNALIFAAPNKTDPQPKAKEY